jgi:hypothetical protein
MSNLGVSLSVDVSAVSQSDSEEEEEEEEEGAGRAASSAAHQTAHNSAYSACGRLDEARSASGALEVHRICTQGCGAGIPHVAGQETAVVAAKGPKAALFKEAWAGKLARRPPTTGVALTPAAGQADAGAAAALITHAGASCQAQAEEHGASAPIGSSCERASSDVLTFKTLTQPEVGEDEGYSSGSNSSGGGCGRGASAAELLARRSPELRQECGAKLGRRPPTPGAAIGQRYGATASLLTAAADLGSCKPQQGSRRRSKSLGSDLAQVRPHEPLPFAPAAVTRRASLPPTMSALMQHNPDLGLDVLESSSASSPTEAAPASSPRPAQAAPAAANEGRGRSDWAAKLLKRPPTPGVGFGQSASMFEDGREGGELTPQKDEAKEAAQLAEVGRAVARATAAVALAAAGRADEVSAAGQRHGSASPGCNSKAGSRRGMAEDVPAGMPGATAAAGLAAADSSGSRSSSSARGSGEGGGGRRRATCEVDVINRVTGPALLGGAGSSCRRRVTFDVAPSAYRRPWCSSPGAASSGGCGAAVWASAAASGGGEGGGAGTVAGGSAERGRRVTFEEEFMSAAQERRASAGKRFLSPPPFVPGRPRACAGTPPRGQRVGGGGGCGAAGSTPLEAKQSQQPLTRGDALLQTGAASAGIFRDVEAPAAGHAVAAATQLAATKGGNAALRAELKEGRGKVRPPTPGVLLCTSVFADDAAAEAAAVRPAAAWPPRRSSSCCDDGDAARHHHQAHRQGRLPSSAVLAFAGHNPDLATDLREGGGSAGSSANGTASGDGGAFAAAKRRRPPTPGATLGKANVFADEEEDDEEEWERGEPGEGDSAAGAAAAVARDGAGRCWSQVGSADLLVASTAVAKGCAQLRAPSAAHCRCKREPRAHGPASGAAECDGSTSQLPVGSACAATPAACGVGSNAAEAAAVAAACASPLHCCSSVTDPEPTRVCPLRAMPSAPEELSSTTTCAMAAQPQCPAAQCGWEAAASPAMEAPPLQRAASGSGTLAGAGAIQMPPGRMSRCSSGVDPEPGHGSKLRHASPSVEGGARRPPSNSGCGAAGLIGRG